MSDNDNGDMIGLAGLGVGIIGLYLFMNKDKIVEKTTEKVVETIIKEGSEKIVKEYYNNPVGTTNTVIDLARGPVDIVKDMMNKGTSWYANYFGGMVWDTFQPKNLKPVDNIILGILGDNVKRTFGFAVGGNGSVPVSTAPLMNYKAWNEQKRLLDMGKITNNKDGSYSVEVLEGADFVQTRKLLSAIPDNSRIILNGSSNPNVRNLAGGLYDATTGKYFTGYGPSAPVNPPVPAAAVDPVKSVVSNVTIHVSQDAKAVSTNPLPGFTAVTMPTSYVNTYVQALDRVQSKTDLTALNRSAGILAGTFHTKGR